MQISVIFVQPETPGNIGSLSRVMKNFGLNELILVDPCCPMDKTAYYRAKHAADILESAKIMPTFDSAIEGFDIVIGSSAVRGGSYNLLRSYLTPEELVSSLRNRDGKVAIVFGREGEGLHNNELELCDVVVHIPAAQGYPTLNITHAAAIIFYELFRIKNTHMRHELAGTEEKKHLFQFIENITDILEEQDFKRENILLCFKRVINREFLTKREIYTLIGFFRGIYNIIKTRNINTTKI